nr:unnamed protein product [Callosobruchus analis]
MKNKDIKLSNTVSKCGTTNMIKVKTKDTLLSENRNLQFVRAVVHTQTVPMLVSTTPQMPREDVSNKHSTGSTHGVNNAVAASSDDHEHVGGARDLNLQKEWINITRSKSRRNSKNAIIRSAKNMCSVKVAPKKISLFVSRLQPGTKYDDLVTFLRKTFPEAVCEEITPKHPKSYASSKVLVNYESLDRALEPSSWPEGTYVTRFFQRRSRVAADTYT